MKSISSSSVVSKPNYPVRQDLPKWLPVVRSSDPTLNFPYRKNDYRYSCSDLSKVQSRESAILESVASNIEAGINIVDRQEMEKRKIGGKLADVSLSLNTCKSPKSTISIRERAQADLEFAKSCIRDIAQTVYHDTALFSNGPTKPVTIAIPNMGEWEGIDITRPDLSLPGMQTVLNGKVHGDSKDYFLDSESIRRAFDEWRNHCIQNRLLWGKSP